MRKRPKKANLETCFTDSGNLGSFNFFLRETTKSFVQTVTNKGSKTEPRLQNKEDYNNQSRYRSIPLNLADVHYKSSKNRRKAVAEVVYSIEDSAIVFKSSKMTSNTLVKFFVLLSLWNIAG